jgi:hypothetical protein
MSEDTLRAFGFIADKPGRYDLHYDLMRMSTFVMAKADHYEYRRGYTYQNGYGLCVCEAVRRTVQLRYSILGLNTCFLISDIAPYAVARADAYATAFGLAPEDIPKLDDIGLEPYRALVCLQDTGIVMATDMPGPAELGESFDPANIFIAPKDFPNNLLVKAMKLRGLTFKQVDYSTFEEFKIAIKTLMKQGFPILYAINGRPLVNVTTQVVTELPASGQNHMIALLSAEDDSQWRSDNWWRRDVIRPGLEDIDTFGQADGTWLHTAQAMYEGANNVLAITWRL